MFRLGLPNLTARDMTPMTDPTLYANYKQSLTRPLLNGDVSPPSVAMATTTFLFFPSLSLLPFSLTPLPSSFRLSCRAAAGVSCGRIYTALLHSGHAACSPPGLTSITVLDVLQGNIALHSESRPAMFSLQQTQNKPIDELTKENNRICLQRPGINRKPFAYSTKVVFLTLEGNRVRKETLHSPRE